MSEYGLIWAISASQLGKPCAARGKTLIQPRVGPVAQWLEPAAHNRLVGGSSPSGPTKILNMNYLRLILRDRIERCRLSPLVLKEMVWARSSIFSVSLMAPVTPSSRPLVSKDLGTMHAAIGGNDVQLGGSAFGRRLKRLQSARHSADLGPIESPMVLQSGLSAGNGKGPGSYCSKPICSPHSRAFPCYNQSWTHSLIRCSASCLTISTQRRLIKRMTPLSFSLVKTLDTVSMVRPR